MSILACLKDLLILKGSVALRRYGDFFIFIITVVHYLLFEKLKFASGNCVQSEPTRHPAKFCCNSLNGCIKMAFKKFKQLFT